MTGSRQLAAIMFTDIVGYTALMGRDEQKALAVLDQSRQLHKALIAQHGGRWIKEMGDGVLASFATVSDAVTAAIELQESCRADNAFQLRIGIHLGEVVVEKEDVFGDGVNIASRIQAIARPGRIYISEPVYLNIANKKEFRTEYIGEENLKNVVEPVRIYAVLTGDEQAALPRWPTFIHRHNRLIWFGSLGLLALVLLINFLIPRISDRGGLISPAYGIKGQKIAVLPIANYSGNPENDYVSAGLHNALIDELSRLSGFTVISRTSTMRFRDSELSAQEIARELGVDNLVEASMLCSGDSVCIMVQMIRPFPDESALWSNSYVQEWGQLMSFYRNAARNIASAINLELTPQEKLRLESGRRIHPELYKTYLLGMFHINKMTAEGMQEGIQKLKEAMEYDPLEPLPYLGLAIAYSNAGHATGAGEDTRQLSIAYAQRALELDTMLAEAYSILGSHYLYTAWDWEKADYALRRANQINANSAYVHYTYGWHLLLTGRKEEAVEEMKRAIENDPLNPMSPGYLAWLYVWIGDYTEAMPPIRRILELNANHPLGNYLLGMVYSQQGQHGLAIETHNKGLAAYPAFRSGLGVAYALAGRRDEALQVIRQLEEQPSPWNFWGLADVYAALGETDQALHWMERAFEAHQDFMPWIESYDLYKPLRNSPRFQELVRRLNLPE